MRIKIGTPLNAIFVVLALMLGFFSGCNKIPLAKTTTYKIYTPTYKSKAEALATINGNALRPVKDAGKISILGNFIYLNELDKGIHIIDNSDPGHPKQVAFLDIPGNQNVAVRGNILYADMYTDLLAIDISNAKNVVIRKRIPNLFPMRSYVNGNYIDSSQVVVDWVTRDTTVTEESTIFRVCPNCMFASADGAKAASAGGNSVAGSMAAMVLMQDHMYAIMEPHSVGVINVEHAADPELKNTFFAGFDLETIYPFENKLFLGSSIGMFMYDLSDPENPVQLGSFAHGRACDPVITDGEYAFVTLHSGSFCGGEANELHVVDVKDLMNPHLTSTYQLTSPTGLSKDGNLLFVCDASSGVRIYDAATPTNLRQIKTIDVKDGYDVMASNGHAMIIATNGLYQFDYSNINDVRQISFFSLK